MIWRLLKRNISSWQISGYAIANLIGLAIIMSAIRFYNDTANIIGNNGNSVAGNDYLVISKPVSMLNTIGLGSATTISMDEIENIKEQPWVENVGEFAAANFSVAASIDFKGRGMSTYLFLESVPDEFIDNKPRQWGFNPAEGLNQEIPVIISKDYLALYNYGFASTRNLPQLSENIIENVPIALYLSGKGNVDKAKARIVGFSNRLNTIAVPYDFINWANQKYSYDSTAEPSRLIIEVNDPGAPEIKEFMDDKGYEVAGDRMDTSKMSYFLKLITTIVIAIGAIISALALFILMLSITLLLQKNKEKNSYLLLLGYSQSQVGKVYFNLIVLVNACVWILACVFMVISSTLWQKPLSELGIASSSPLEPCAIGLGIAAVITLANFFLIRRNIRE